MAIKTMVLYSQLADYSRFHSFLTPPRKMKIGSRNWEVREITGLRNHDSTVRINFSTFSVPDKRGVLGQKPKEVGHLTQQNKC